MTVLLVQVQTVAVCVRVGGGVVVNEIFVGAG
jgi:hypothetical protein